LLLHLAPLVVLIGWPGTPLAIPAAIPIQLVIEQPPPQPPPAPKPAAPSPPKPQASPPPPGMRASDDFGAVAGDKTDHNTGETPPTPGAPAEAKPPDPGPEASPTKEQLAVAPFPTPAEIQALAPPPPLPEPPKPSQKQQAAIHLPKPEGEAWPLPLTGPSRAPAHTAALVGPNASRDEYCAYALSLVMSHVDLLPLSLIGARHGDTSITMRVLSDGTISMLRVTRGSGYPDIDERVAQMVLAVGKLPPLPQWIPGNYTDLTFHMHFPHPSEH